MICPRCDAALDDEAPECPSCGFIFRMAPRPEASSGSDNPGVPQFVLEEVRERGWELDEPVKRKKTPLPRLLLWLVAGATLLWLVYHVGSVTVDFGPLREALAPWSGEGPDQGEVSVVVQPPGKTARPRAPSGWMIRGRALDLVSLKPVRRATLSFEDARSGRRYEVAAFDDGRFSAELPPLADGGYVLRAEGSGYTGRYWVAGSQEKPPSRREGRLALARTMARTLSPPSVLRAGLGSLDVVVYLVPNIKR